MATIRFLGTAPTVAQVDTFTPADVEVDDVFTLTATGLDGTTAAISFTATAATVANVTAGLTAAWNASTHALCTPITAADGTTVLTLTADVAGVAFSVAGAAVNGGAADTQTLSRAATTKNEGPSDWSSTANWSGGALPGGAASQDVYIEDTSVSILYGLDQSGIANALASLNFSESFTGAISSNGAAGVAAAYLKIKTSALNIGYRRGPGISAGSGRIKIDLGSTACTVTISNTGANTDTAKPSVRLLADSASTTVRVVKGKVGLAFEAGETSTVGTVTIHYDTSVNNDAEVTIGSGVTVTTITKSGGDLDLACAATTVTQDAGTLTTRGTGAITTMNINGGQAEPNSVGTITNLNVKGTGIADFTKSVAARTVTTPKVDPGGVLKYDPAVVTLTTKIQPISASGNVSYTCAAA